MKLKFIITILIFYIDMMIMGSDLVFPKLPAIQNDNSYLKKTLSDIPSNDIYELFLKNDELWVMTSEGLAFTDDWGNNWKNYLLYNDIKEVIFSFNHCDMNDTYYAAAGYMRDYASLDNAAPVGTGVYYKKKHEDEWNFERIAFKDQLPQKVGYEIGVLDSNLFIACVRGNLLTKNIKDSVWRVIIPDENSENDTLKSEEYPPNYDYVNDFNNIALSVKVDRDGVVWLGTAAGLKISADSGKTFTSLTSFNTDNIPGNQIWELTDYYENDEKTIYISCTSAGYEGEKNGVAYTKDNGKTWRNIEAYENIAPLSLKGYKGNLWAGTEQGLTRWIPGSDTLTWFNRTNSALLDNYIASLAAHDFYLWVGTYNGLAYSVTQGNSFTIIQKSFPTSFTGIKETYSFPNPFSPKVGQMAQIVFSLAESNYVELIIYDLTFMKVRTLTKGEYAASLKHIVEWDGRDDDGNELPNGTYYYRIKLKSDQNDRKTINKITILN